MKKLLAFAIILTFVAGAAFAQVSGLIETRLYLVDVIMNDDPNPQIHGDIGAAYLQISGTNDDGTLGGRFRLRGTDVAFRGDNGWIYMAYAWWRPIQQVRIYLGIDQDGMFDTASIAGWAFHAGDNDYMFNHHWDFWRGIFPGNWDGFGLAFSFWPMEGLNLNLVVPVGGIGWPQATASQVRTKKDWEDMIFSLRLQGSYTIQDVGVIQFAYNMGDKDLTPQIAFQDGGHFGRIGLSFLLTSLDSMSILIGSSFVPYDGGDILISPGVGFAYSGSSFGVKARVGANIQGDSKQFINANVMPYFNLGPGQLMIDIGLSMQLDKDTDNLGWYATPVFRLPVSGGTFSIGLQLYSNIKMGGNIELSGNTDVTFRMPMLLRYSF